jgi:hypothetical protein
LFRKDEYSIVSQLSLPTPYAKERSPPIVEEDTTEREEELDVSDCSGGKRKEKAIVAADK